MQELSPEKAARQLELYARDLHDLYQSEKQKRSELAEERLVLQFRIKELESLNRLFQQHLAASARREESYQRILEQLKKLLELKDEADWRQQLRKLLDEAAPPQ